MIDTAKLTEVEMWNNFQLYTDGEKYYAFIGGNPVQANTLNLLKMEIRNLLT
jgi:hypothetical protein